MAVLMAVLFYMLGLGSGIFIVIFFLEVRQEITQHPIPWKVCDSQFVDFFSIRDANDNLVWWGDYLFPLQIIAMINNVVRSQMANLHCK